MRNAQPGKGHYGFGLKVTDFPGSLSQKVNFPKNPSTSNGLLELKSEACPIFSFGGKKHDLRMFKKNFVCSLAKRVSVQKFLTIVSQH